MYRNLWLHLCAATKSIDCYSCYWICLLQNIYVIELLPAVLGWSIKSQCLRLLSLIWFFISLSQFYFARTHFLSINDPWMTMGYCWFLLVFIFSAFVIVFLFFFLSFMTDILLSFFSLYCFSSNCMFLVYYTWCSFQDKGRILNWRRVLPLYRSACYCQGIYINYAMVGSKWEKSSPVCKRR